MLAGAALLCTGDARRRLGAATPDALADPPPMNLHPLGDRFLDLQRAALRALGTTWIRVTLGLLTDTVASRAYVGAVPNLLGLVSDFHQRTIAARAWPDLVEATLRRYPEVQRAELLNEPEQFYGLSPASYVRDFLRPGFERIRERFPDVAVVAAAPIGNRRQGLDYFRSMTDAGADRYCDYRAVHVYFEDERVLSAFASATGRAILVTETGIGAPGQHVRWYTEVMPVIRQALGATAGRGRLGAVSPAGLRSPAGACSGAAGRRRRRWDHHDGDSTVTRRNSIQACSPATKFPSRRSVTGVAVPRNEANEGPPSGPAAPAASVRATSHAR